MRLPFYGLRVGILTQLVFLIIAAVLLVNVAMLKFSERDLVHAKVNTGRLLIHAMGQNMGYLLKNSKNPSKEINSDINFRMNVEKLLSGGGYSSTVIVDHNGSLIFNTSLSSRKKQYCLTLAREAMGTRAWSVNYSGNIWGVLWLSKRDISISAPLLFEGRPLGGITISSSLTSIYQLLRKTEKVILFYIILDTIIIALVGIHLLSRIIVKPIHELLKMTEEYKYGEIIPSIAQDSKNEIGSLSRSLSNMIQQLDENKRELKAHISSLEKANRELKQAQSEIIRSEKLASVGRLSAGIAHEIGNPIGIIIGYLELLSKGDIKDEERKDFLNRVEAEITRVNLIISQLLDFSRPSSGKKEENRVHELIIDTVNMMKPQPLMDDIHINFDLKASRDTVLADPNQLQQVFLNIIMNAADVLVEKDLPQDKDSMDLTIMSENSGDSLEIKFMDNGPGIAEKELIHLFDPFYTTKEPGKGTGLGLSVCYRIVEGHGGTISAESIHGRGTTIIINFPLHLDPKDGTPGLD
ncbi:ATP-binding protein [Thermodesulfobacteriota bacterium]